MEMPTPSTCTIERLEKGCKPGFANLLTDLGLDTTLPEVK